MNECDPSPDRIEEFLEVNKSAISKVESNLHEINSGYEDLRLQFDEYKKITEVLIQRDRFQHSTTFEYSNVIDKVNPSETKRYQDEVSRLKKDLSSEREKSKRLEADLSILIKGRSCEVNELNDIIASLEFKLKATEATNVSLRDLIKTKISNSKQNEIFPSNTATKNDKQCAVNHVEQSNLVLNRVLGEKNSLTDLAQKSHVTSNLVVSNNRRVDKDLSVKDNQLIPNSDSSPADLLQSHNNNLINGAKSRDGQHMKGNSNARKLPNITELKSLLQVPGVSATMNEVDNKVDTYPIIDGHHCSLRNVSSSTFNVLKDI